MADDKQDRLDDEVDEAVADAESDTVKTPDESEREPANTEGSESKLP